MSAVMGELSVDPADVAADQVEDLAHFVVTLWLRRRKYLDQFDVFSHQLLLKMQAMGLRQIRGRHYTIRVAPETRRKPSSCFHCGSIMGDDNRPARIVIEKVAR